jgi:hypothetical protein
MSLQQVYERLKGFGSEVNFLVAAPEPVLAGLQREIGKPIDALPHPRHNHLMNFSRIFHNYVKHIITLFATLSRNN